MPNFPNLNKSVKFGFCQSFCLIGFLLVDSGATSFKLLFIKYLHLLQWAVSTPALPSLHTGTFALFSWTLASKAAHFPIILEEGGLTQKAR